MNNTNVAVKAEPTREELLARIAQLESTRKAPSMGFKVTDKGGVSVYGLGRFPVSLYLSQWERLFEKIDDLKAFIAENRDKLAVKPEAK